MGTVFVPTRIEGQYSSYLFGPGYRVYFGKDGERLVILLAGGTKKRQQCDIETAQSRWDDYKLRKRQKGGE